MGLDVLPPTDKETEMSIKRKLTYIALLGLVLTALWIGILEGILEPEIDMKNASLTQLLPSWLLPPLVVLMLGVGVQSAYAQVKQRSAATEAVPLASAGKTAQLTHEDHAQQQFTLDVMGLGLVIEKFRQRHAYDALKAAPGSHDNLLPQDPKAYPWSEAEKYNVSEKRGGDVLEHAASWFVWKWPIPVFAIGPLNKNPRAVRLLTGNPQEAGMHWHTFVWADTVLDPTPDMALAKIFDFFDRNPQVPAVLVMAQDGEVIRDVFRAPGTPPLVTNRYRQKSDPTETVTAFILAKRDRVDQFIRPWVLEETTKQAGTNALDVFYGKMEESGTWKNGHIPMAEEWLTQVASFQPQATKPGFTPSPWLPQPWTEKQLARFDKLPILGHLHRPQTARFTDEHGKPLTDNKKTAAFKAVWQAALSTLPEGQAPSRLFYDYGTADKGSRIVPLSRALAELDSPLDPMRDGVNVTQRFGDMGAATPFAQLGLGVMAGWEEGGVSASVTLRDDGRATVIMLSPPAEKKRHPGGIDPIGWKFKPTPQPKKNQ